MGSADRLALFPFWLNSIGTWEKAMREVWSSHNLKYFLLRTCACRPDAWRKRTWLDELWRSEKWEAGLCGEWHVQWCVHDWFSPSLTADSAVSNHSAWGLDLSMTSRHRMHQLPPSIVSSWDVHGNGISGGILMEIPRVNGDGNPMGFGMKSIIISMRMGMIRCRCVITYLLIHLLT